VKFDVRKKREKNQWVLQKCYSFCRDWTQKKFCHTAMADNATDWKVIIVAKSCVHRECVRWKAIFFHPEGMIGNKVHVENERRFQAILPDAHFIRVRPDSGSSRFCEAARGIKSRIWAKTLLPLLPIIPAITNLKKKCTENYSWLSCPLTSHILRDGVFEGLPPDGQFVRYEAR